jgi:hypothetical protein
MADINKVVLAYSGGLDTSVILKWLQDTYHCEIVTFTADLGQGEELEPARAKALQFGIKPENIFIDDLREEFVRDFVFPMFRANTIYEGEYLLGTSIARPLIAKRQIEIARMTGADSVSHGATGKGNDQVRFELGYYALEPGIKVIAPWREWDLLSREKLLAYAEKNGIPVEMKHKQGGAPYSVLDSLIARNNQDEKDELTIAIQASRYLLQSMSQGVRINWLDSAEKTHRARYSDLLAAMQRWTSDLQAVAQGGNPRYYPKHLSTLKSLSQTAKVPKLHHFWKSLVQARRHENHPLANRVQLEALLSQYQQVFES